MKMAIKWAVPAAMDRENQRNAYRDKLICVGGGSGQVASPAHEGALDDVQNPRVVGEVIVLLELLYKCLDLLHDYSISWNTDAIERAPVP
jgi:hypothetical protein